MQRLPACWLVFLGYVHALSYEQVGPLAPRAHKFDHAGRRDGIRHQHHPQAPTRWAEHLLRLDGTTAEVYALAALQLAPLAHRQTEGLCPLGIEARGAWDGERVGQAGHVVLGFNAASLHSIYPLHIEGFSAGERDDM